MEQDRVLGQDDPFLHELELVVTSPLGQKKWLFHLTEIPSRPVTRVLLAQDSGLNKSDPNAADRPTPPPARLPPARSDLVLF